MANLRFVGLPNLLARLFPSRCCPSCAQFMPQIGWRILGEAFAHLAEHRTLAETEYVAYLGDHLVRIFEQFIGSYAHIVVDPKVGTLSAEHQQCCPEVFTPQVERKCVILDRRPALPFGKRREFVQKIRPRYHIYVFIKHKSFSSALNGQLLWGKRQDNVLDGILSMQILNTSICFKVKPKAKIQ